MKTARFVTGFFLALGLANIGILYSFSTAHFKYPGDREFLFQLIAANIVWMTFGLWSLYKKFGSIVRVLWLAVGVFLVLLTLLGLVT